ncbi:MAG: 16S rRNA (uracil(1498)-N(3))-methyltransferase [Acidobacteriota bacterium]|jgi:16S rRNA (uracil1498-N3)-methyltransferase
MTRRRFYVPRDSIRNGIAALPPTEAHHLRDVLRVKAGDRVEIFDDSGTGYTGEVELHGSEVFVQKLESIPSLESPFRLILAAALIKSARFEWMLQKATELGVDRIIPLKTRLSEIQITDEKIEERKERWQRIIREAAKQCKRSAAPRLEKPLDFAALLAAEEISQCTKILFHEKAAGPWQPKGPLSDRIILCIGPEGGWEQSEVEQAGKAGYQICGLGPWTLRAETAAIAAISIVQHQIQLLRSQEQEARSQRPTS